MPILSFLKHSPLPKVNHVLVIESVALNQPKKLLNKLLMKRHFVIAATGSLKLNYPKLEDNKKVREVTPKKDGDACYCENLVEEIKILQADQSWEIGNNFIF